MAPIRFAILTVSDTCAKGEEVDESDLGLKAHISSAGSAENIVSCTAIVQHNEALIMKHLIDWSDENKADVILTTSDIEFSKIDVTPVATNKIIHYEAVMLYLDMLARGPILSPKTLLSRAVCGIRNKTLIINLPGWHKDAIEWFTAVAHMIPHYVDWILDD